MKLKQSSKRELLLGETSEDHGLGQCAVATNMRFYTCVSRVTRYSKGKIVWVRNVEEAAVYWFKKALVADFLIIFRIAVLSYFKDRGIPSMSCRRWGAEGQD